MRAVIYARYSSDRLSPIDTVQLEIGTINFLI